MRSESLGYLAIFPNKSRSFSLLVFKISRTTSSLYETRSKTIPFVTVTSIRRVPSKTSLMDPPSSIFSNVTVVNFTRSGGSMAEDLPQMFHFLAYRSNVRGVRRAPGKLYSSGKFLEIIVAVVSKNSEARLIGTRINGTNLLEDVSFPCNFARSRPPSPVGPGIKIPRYGG